MDVFKVPSGPPNYALPPASLRYGFVWQAIKELNLFGVFGQVFLWPYITPCRPQAFAKLRLAPLKPSPNYALPPASPCYGFVWQAIKEMSLFGDS